VIGAAGIDEAPAEAEGVAMTLQFAETVSRIVTQRLGDRIPACIRPAVVFSKHHVVAERAQTGQPMQDREDVTANRVPAEVAGDDR
jgi:hypothetical protein